MANQTNDECFPLVTYLRHLKYSFFTFHQIQPITIWSMSVYQIHLFAISFLEWKWAMEIWSDLRRSPPQFDNTGDDTHSFLIVWASSPLSTMGVLATVFWIDILAPWNQFGLISENSSTKGVLAVVFWIDIFVPELCIRSFLLMN